MAFKREIISAVFVGFYTFLIRIMKWSSMYGWPGNKTKMGVCKKSRKQLEKGTAKIWHFLSQVCKEHGLRQKGI